MKTLARTLALVLALGATMQALFAYANDVGLISIEEEETKIVQLIELKQQMDTKNLSIGDIRPELNRDFPQIKTEEDFREAFATHALRYLRAINGEDALRRVLDRPEFSSIRRSDGEPGI